MPDYGWVNPGNGQSAIGLDKGTTFDNQNTGQIEAGTSQGGTGNPFANAPTGNYADAKWTPQQQYQYSTLMSQGRNQEAAQLGQQAWQNVDQRRAERGSISRSWQAAAAGRNGGGGSSGSGSGGPGGPFSNAVYNPETKTWSVYGGADKGWTDNIGRNDIQSHLTAADKAAHPDWYWGDQVDQADTQRERQLGWDVQKQNQYADMANSQIKYSPSAVPV